ncbi:OmpA family protein [Fulvivirga sp. M361]|uniref:OmpA family protein n=1 Tax=Fulvivirga sp. M361 TaxID=2594266 RepID=UPI00117A329C|nr:OmpA family protein [Fulvivirga sp. M361]TRX52069.1 OmpA family protein [Fulvivirga sp. M361]
MKAKSKIKLLLFAILISGHADGQIGNLFKTSEQRGDELFNEFAYTQAIDQYKIALDKTDKPGIVLKIADSYRKLNDPASSSEWYAKALESQVSEPLAYLHYAEALSSMENYEDAKKWYKKYDTFTSEDNRPDMKIEAIDNLTNQEDRSKQVTITLTGFNSGASDFSPTFYEGDQVLFVSAREQNKALPNLFNWDKSEYLNIYLADPSGTIEAFHKQINSKYHEGPMAIYSNATRMIFTRNDYFGSLGRSSEGITKLKLYTSSKNADGTWNKPLKFKYNSSEYSVGHPTVTEDGTLLIFVSDMPGGYGGTDLYWSKWVEGEWSEPENMGKTVNTKGNEMFPFVSDENQLFFASNGHGGFGGLDQFGIDLEKLDKSIPVNLGKPLNSSFDDFGLIIRAGKGYFSSNREGSKNNDDIYSFTSTGPLLRSYTLKGVIADSDKKQPLSNAAVSLKGPDGKVLEQAITNAKGEYFFLVDPETQYTLEVTKEEYLSNNAQVDINDNTKLDWIKNLNLKPDYGFNLLGTIKEKGSGQAIEGVKVTMIDNMTGKQALNVTTDNKGEFFKSIEDKELNDRISYQIKLEREGYLSKMMTYNTELKEPGTINLNEFLNIRMDKIDVGTDIGKLIDINPIYFDLGKYNIRTDAAMELDKIVKIMKENPTIEIELGSHTDSRGSASSNERLSDNRAKASAEYVVSKGISKNRITGKGYGESQLINRCSDGVKCSKDEHQKNRRTEFKIIKY